MPHDETEGSGGPRPRSTTGVQLVVNVLLAQRGETFYGMCNQIRTSGGNALAATHAYSALSRYQIQAEPDPVPSTVQQISDFLEISPHLLKHQPMVVFSKAPAESEQVAP